MSRVIIDRQAVAAYADGVEAVLGRMSRTFQEKDRAYERQYVRFSGAVTDLEHKRSRWHRELADARAELERAQSDEEDGGDTSAARQRIGEAEGKLEQIRAMERRLTAVWMDKSGEVRSCLEGMSAAVDASSGGWRKAREGLEQTLQLAGLADRALSEDSGTVAGGSAAGGSSGAVSSGGGRGRKPAYEMHRCVTTGSDGGKELSLTIGGLPFCTKLNKAGTAAAYRRAVACGDTEMAERCSALFEIETMRQTLGLRGCSGDAMQLGGYHKEVKGRPGYESHHIPQQSVQDVNKDYLPTIALLKEDHKLTDSYAGKSGAVHRSVFPGGPEAGSYKQEVSKDIQGGGYLHVVYCELLNLKDRFGDKYNGGISQYLDSLADMIALRGIPDVK